MVPDHRNARRDDDSADGDHRDAAILALAADDPHEAGDQYTLAAYGTLAGHEGFQRDAFDPDRTCAGDGLRYLFLAGLCYRVAGVERARNRALQGILVATDQRDHVRAGVDSAACQEFVGHCRVLSGDTDRASEAYDRAADRYLDAAVDDPAGATTRPLLNAGTDLLTQVSRPDDVAWDDIHGNGEAALERRVRFARSRLPGMVDRRIEAGKLHAPRGSTEYGNDSFSCPDCGSNDVNYVADTVLCLRCSAETERV